MKNTDLKNVLCSLLLYLFLGYLSQSINLFNFKITLIGTFLFLMGSLCYSFYITKKNSMFLVYSVILFLISLSFSH